MKEKHILPSPPIIQELKKTWPSLVGKIPGLTKDLEIAFRQGHQVHSTVKGYILGGNLKGGSSCIWKKTSRDIYQIYQDWHKEEGFQVKIDGEEREKLASLLYPYGIEILEGNRDGNFIIPEECYALTREIFSLLPPHHLFTPYFQKLHLGGWGPDSAKGSAYFNGKIIMYDFTINGPKRTYAAFLLHEIGHVHAHILTPSQKAALEEHYQQICKLNEWIGLEFFWGVHARMDYQRLYFNEFLAETYLHYIVIGQDLPQFLERMSTQGRNHWKAVFQIFQESFHDWEYT